MNKNKEYERYMNKRVGIPIIKRETPAPQDKYDPLQIPDQQ